MTRTPSAPHTPRTVLVTGGNRGIGLAVAKALAARGDKVAVTYRGEPPAGAVEIAAGAVGETGGAGETGGDGEAGGAGEAGGDGEAEEHDDPAGGGLFAIRCDVTSPDDVEAAFTAVEAQLGPVEILISNAGITDDQLLLSMKEDAWSSVIDANLTAAYRVARRATSKMIRARWGRMIFVSSVVALTGSAGQTNYAASKAGLVGFARSLAREIGGRGVTVNVVAPGFVETDMTDALPESRRAEILEAVPLKRMAHADEIAAAVAYLSSDEAGYVTGAVIPVDGGLGMGH